MPFIIRETQIKTTLSFIFIRLAKVQKLDNSLKPMEKQVISHNGETLWRGFGKPTYLAFDPPLGIYSDDILPKLLPPPPPTKNA